MLSKIFKTLKKRPEIFILAYFALIALFVAFVINKGVPPDEIYHYDSINYYAKYSADPVVGKQVSYFQLGDVSRETSYLYHYLLSVVPRTTNLFNMDSFYILRTVNILIGVFTLIVLNKLAIVLGLARKFRLTALFAIASMPMFFFLSASINYDNAVILLAALSALFGVNLSKKFQIEYVLGLVLLLIIGPLVKFAFLPISLTIGLFLVIMIYKNNNLVKREFNRIKANKPILLAVTVLMFLTVSYLAGERYGVNIINYGKIRPNCNQILTHEQCLQNNIYKRTKEFNDQKLSAPAQLPIEVYVVQWTRIMISRIYGVLGHKSFDSNRVVVTTMFFAFFGGTIYFIRMFWRNQRSRKNLFLLSMFIVYTSALILENYSSYRRRGIITLAVQGRYWLPVLFPFILYVISLGKSEEVNSNISNYLLAVICIVAFIFGLPYFISGISYEWLSPSVQSLVNHIL